MNGWPFAKQTFTRWKQEYDFVHKNLLVCCVFYALRKTHFVVVVAVRNISKVFPLFHWLVEFVNCATVVLRTFSGLEFVWRIGSLQHQPPIRINQRIQKQMNEILNENTQFSILQVIAQRFMSFQIKTQPKHNRDHFIECVSSRITRKLLSIMNKKNNDGNKLYK